MYLRLASTAYVVKDGIEFPILPNAENTGIYRHAQLQLSYHLLRGRDENKVIVEGVELKDFPVMGLWFPILESEPKASGAL